MDRLNIHDIPIGSVITSDRFIILETNKICAELFNITEDSLNSLSFLSLFAEPDDFPEFLSELEVNKELKDYRIKLKNKEGRFLSCFISAKQIQTNPIKYIFTVVQYVTGNKQANRKLLESESKLNSIYKSAPIGIGMVTNRVINFANETFCRMLGYSMDELIGEKSLIHYPNLEEFEKVGKIKYEQIRIKGTGSIETKFVTKYGKILDIFLSSTPLDVNDLSKGVVFTAMDITERKKADLIKEIIYNISNAVISTPNLQEFIRTIRIELGQIINTSNFFVALYDKDSNSFSSPFSVDEKDKFMSWPAKKTLTGYIIEHQKPLLVTKDEILELVDAGEIDLVGTVSEIWLGVPLVVEDKTIGALVVQDYNNPHEFNKNDFDILEFVSHQISLCIERKRAEDKINELQEYQKIQIEKMPIGLIVWNEFFEVKSWNPAAETIFGYLETEAIGKHAIELIIPESLHAEFELIWEKLVEDGITTTNITTNIRNNGEQIICQWQFTPLKKENGAIIGVLSMVQDITEKEKAEQALRESEEKYKNLVNHSPDGIFIIDLEGNFKSANKIMYETIRSDEETLLSKNIWDIIPSSYIKQFEARLSKLINGENLAVPIEYQILTENGSKRYIEVISSPFYENGIITGFQGIARDVTFRKETENELKLYQEKLEDLVNERTAKLELQTDKLKESHQALSFLVLDVNESRKNLRNRTVKYQNFHKL